MNWKVLNADMCRELKESSWKELWKTKLSDINSTVFKFNNQAIEEMIKKWIIPPFMFKNAMPATYYINLSCISPFKL